jgi:hypothetical protein
LRLRILTLQVLLFQSSGFPDAFPSTMEVVVKTDPNYKLGVRGPCLSLEKIAGFDPGVFNELIGIVDSGNKELGLDIKGNTDHYPTITHRWKYGRNLAYRQIDRILGKLEE